jgi:hypothetical protein
MQQENLANIRHKLSIIYKHIQAMHNELRYQAKRHAISEKLSKERIIILHLLPQFFFSMLKKNKTEKQQKHAYGEKK